MNASTMNLVALVLATLGQLLAILGQLRFGYNELATLG